MAGQIMTVVRMSKIMGFFHRGIDLSLLCKASELVSERYP
jgi:hypothetical protein